MKLYYAVFGKNGCGTTLTRGRAYERSIKLKQGAYKGFFSIDEAKRYALEMYRTLSGHTDFYGPVPEGAVLYKHEIKQLMEKDFPINSRVEVLIPPNRFPLYFELKQ